MTTVTVPKKEYERLKHFSSAYLKIAEEIANAERAYPYDYKFIRTLVRQAQEDYKKGKSIEAESVDEALAKLHKQ
jgi:hypothetical protein